MSELAQLAFSTASSATDRLSEAAISAAAKANDAKERYDQWAANDSPAEGAGSPSWTASWDRATSWVDGVMKLQLNSAEQRAENAKNKSSPAKSPSQ
jgi:hypothetical protein